MREHRLTQVQAELAEAPMDSLSDPAEMALIRRIMAWPRTVEAAAASTGLDAGVLGQIAQQLGGEGGLGQLSGLLKGNPQLAGIADMLDRDGDGNPINDVMGMASSLFGKK